MVDAALSHAGLPFSPHVITDLRLLRPTEVEDLRGDPTLAHERLGWSAQVTFETIMQRMVVAEMEALRMAA
jgi:GDPmannose 4,6-dehydratase